MVGGGLVTVTCPARPNFLLDASLSRLVAPLSGDILDPPLHTAFVLRELCLQWVLMTPFMKDRLKLVLCKMLLAHYQLLSENTNGFQSPMQC